MGTYFTFDESSCPTIQGKQPRNWQRHDESKKTPSRFGWIVLIVMTLLLLIPTAAVSKGGNGNGGGDNPVVVDPVVDFGDVFGDLMHILRHGTTGQPIFAQRWVEMPEGEPGFGWGYCAIAVAEDGSRLPFKPYSCDVEEGAPIVEVDYFGRLNASRVQERNQRMHFNETITNIKQAAQLRLDPTGRLALGFGDPDDPDSCTLATPEYCDWATVDSPMENMALYQRMMKYGHIATDPEEPDLWWHGDPATDPLDIVHPALDKDDFAKFIRAGLDNWLPDREVWDGDGNFIRDYDDCFDLQDEAIVPCLPPEELTFEDFDTSAELLGAAGGKHNFFTEHLVQYLNRFLRITQTTEFAAATLKTLPAMYQDCWLSEDIPDDPPELAEGEVWEDDLAYPYSGGECYVGDVVDGNGDWTIPNWKLYTNVQELFMDFGQSAYVRSGDGGIGGIWDERTAPVALEATLSISIVIDPESTTPRVQEATSTPVAESDPGADSDIWKTVNTDLLDWIEIANDYSPAEMNIHNFVDAASDALRAIEFFHNYEVPENLYCTYSPDNYSCDALAD